MPKQHMLLVAIPIPIGGGEMPVLLEGDFSPKNGGTYYGKPSHSYSFVSPDDPLFCTTHEGQCQHLNDDKEHKH